MIVGLGELLGYSLRLVTGRFADATGLLWPTTIVGYIVQMVSVPLLAFAPNWRTAAGLFILERIGKAIRNPPRDVMLSHAGDQLGGYGWAFGLHEALDQFGAMFGPLVVAALVAARGDYRLAFSALAIPAALNLLCVAAARLVYPILNGSRPNLPRQSPAHRTCRKPSGFIWRRPAWWQQALPTIPSSHSTSPRSTSLALNGYPCSTSSPWPVVVARRFCLGACSTGSDSASCCGWRWLPGFMHRWSGSAALCRQSLAPSCGGGHRRA